MILYTHITIALVGLLLTTLAFFFPSITKLRISYLFVGLTFASGFYLVYSEPAHMLQACTSGLIYLAIVSLCIIAARQKLMQHVKATK